MGSPWGTLGRIAAGVATGGTSELAWRGYEALADGGVDPLSPWKAGQYNPYFVNPDDYTYGGGPGWSDAAKIEQARQENLAREAEGRGAFQPSFEQLNQDYAQQQEARGLLRGFANDLYAQTRGEGGPSLAELQMRAGADRANSSALAMAASGRGGSSLLAQRAALQAQASNQQANNRDTGMLRAQEQATAREQYAGLLGALRQGDLSARQGSLSQAGMISQNEQFQRRLNDERAMQFWQGRQHVADQATALSQGYAGAKYQSIGQADQQKFQASEGAKASQRELVYKAAQGTGSAMTAGSTSGGAPGAAPTGGAPTGGATTDKFGLI